MIIAGRKYGFYQKYNCSLISTNFAYSNFCIIQTRRLIKHVYVECHIVVNYLCILSEKVKYLFPRSEKSTTLGS